MSVSVRVFQTGVWSCQVMSSFGKKSFPAASIATGSLNQDRGSCAIYWLPDLVQFMQKWIKVEGVNIKRVRDLNLDDFLR